MHLTTTKIPITPASLLDRLIAPFTYTWTGLRILLWGEGFIRIPIMDFDSEEELQEFYDKINNLEEDEEE